MLYSSHYFWTALEVRVLLDDPARGPWILVHDGQPQPVRRLERIHGRIIGARVRSEVQEGTRAALTAIKMKLESKEARP